MEFLHKDQTLLQTKPQVYIGKINKSTPFL